MPQAEFKPRFLCFSCEEQGYSGSDAYISVRTDLCEFHGSKGPRARRGSSLVTTDGVASVTSISPKLRPVHAGMGEAEIKKLIVEELDPVDQGILICYIQEVTGISLERLSSICGKSPSWATLKAYPGRVVVPVQEMIRSKRLPLGAAVHIARVRDIYQEPIARQIIEQSVPLRLMREFVTSREKSRVLMMADTSLGGGAVATPALSVDKEPTVLDSPAVSPDLVQQSSVRVEDSLKVMLRAFGEADRGLSCIGELTLREIMDALQDPTDLRSLRTQALIIATRLNDILDLLETVRRRRFPELVQGQK